MALLVQRYLSNTASVVLCTFRRAKDRRNSPQRTLSSKAAKKAANCGDPWHDGKCTKRTRPYWTSSTRQATPSKVILASAHLCNNNNTTNKNNNNITSDNNDSNTKELAMGAPSCVRPGTASNTFLSPSLRRSLLFLYMWNLLGWLETRLAQMILNYLETT